MKDFLKECNKVSGRWNRKKFWLYPLGLGLLIFLTISLIIGSILGFLNSNYLFEIMSGITIIAYIYLFYISYVSYIKRLHDLGKTGWMSLLLFVPLANIYLFIICGFLKGTTGKNQYGEDPLGGIAGNTEENNIPNEL